MKKHLFACVFGAAALLAGCGGGGGDETPAPTAQVPASANASVGGFIAYLKALVAAPASMLEPVDVSGVVPPTDETSEPQVVD
jgi:hypothetical protein